MNKQHKFVNILSVIVMLMLLVGAGARTDSFANAQGAEQPQPHLSLSPVGGGGPGEVPIGFTYQGQIKKDGALYTGSCDMLFSLWDESGTGAPPVGGVQIGATETQTVSVGDGLFTVVLNAGDAFGSAAFNGQRRYLEIAVRCPAGSGAYTTLDSRQLLWATPYAHSLRPGATISGTVDSGATAYGGAILFANNVSTDTNTAGIVGASASTQGAGVVGHATATTGLAYGVIGDSSSPNGRGVYGRATAASGTTYGVKGVSDSSTGAGVQGYSSAGTGVEANSFGGVALYAAGTGIIESVADTELYLSPYTAMARVSSSDLTFSPLENGGVNIYRTVASAGERLVVLPVSTYGKLFGATVYIKSIEVCYKLTSAGPQRITGTGAYKGNGETYATYLYDGTDRTSTTRACYTATAATRAAIDNSSYVQLSLNWMTAGALPDGIRLDTVKLTLTETP